MRKKLCYPRIIGVLGLYIFVFLITPQITRAQTEVTSPEKFFGFNLGSDRKIARWDKIVDYYNLLQKESGKLKVVNMGPSTEGNPFLLVFISSAENIANLDHFQKINAKISDPRGVPEAEMRKLVNEGRAVICQSMSLHATEIGGTQMAPELTHDLISRTDEETTRILDNVIFCLIPSFNPDGQIMVTDWYNQTVGGKYEGTGLPWLYHKYAGHDNNRDGDFLNLQESVYAAKVLYRDWVPQAYIDHHHMGSYGARFYVPPYSDPIRPYADPLVWREMSWYGAHIAYKLEEKDKSGILNAAQYPGWGHFGWHWITPFHNIAGMLTESASAKLATPLFIHPEQLRAGARQFPRYEAQSTFPNPWPGGWWRLSDIVEQKKISAWSLLDLAARNRETVLWNAYLKAKRQTERGAAGTPKAYVIPHASQHDPVTALKMINTLLQSGIEIKRAVAPFNVGHFSYPEGTFVISLAQPKMGLIRNLLGRTIYPDNEWTRGRNGLPLRPYDLATHNMNEFMGVFTQSVENSPDGNFRIMKEQIPLSGTVESGGVGYVISGRLNDSFKAVNLLLEKGIKVQRIIEAAPGLHPGDFVIASGYEKSVKEIADQTGVDFKALKGWTDVAAKAVKAPRIGMYQRYWGGNMDEGWTRLTLEKFAFPYKTLRDADFKKGNISKTLDTIILPSDSTGMITGQIPPQYRRYISTSMPPEYVSGIGAQGIAALKAFVNEGGTLVALAEAGEFAIETFGLSVRNAVANLGSEQFFYAGSTLKVNINNSHPLAYGMPPSGLAVFYGSLAFEVVPGEKNEKYETIARFPGRDMLQSGWLIGEEYLANRAAMVSAPYGEGRIVLIGFRCQHRNQAHGTFKLLFNAIL